MSSACLPAWRSQKATPGTRQAPGLHLHHDTCTCMSAHLARPVVSPCLTVALEGRPHGVGARSGQSSVTPSTQEAPTELGDGERVTGALRGRLSPAGTPRRHGAWVGPQQGLMGRGAQWAVPLPCTAGRPKLALWEQPAHPGSRIQKPPSPARMRGFAPGSQLSRAPEDMAGAPPSSREDLHLDGHLGGSPSLGPAASLTRWRQHSTAAQRCRELDPAPWHGASHPLPVPGFLQAQHEHRAQHQEAETVIPVLQRRVQELREVK